MRIIDVHTHTFPDKIAAAALEALQKDSGSKAHTDGTVSGLRKSMEEAGVDVSVVLPVVTNPIKASSINNYSAKQNEDFEKTGVFMIGGIHPETPEYKKVLREAADMGVKGVKLHPDYYGISFDDIRMKRIIDAASEAGLFVITHAGIDIGLYPPICCSLDSILNVLKDVRPETLILAHMGGWMNWEEVTEVLAPVMAEYNSEIRNKNGRKENGVYRDTAFSIGEIVWQGEGDHKGYHQMPDEQFRKMVKTFGSENILFATDCPWAEQKDYVIRINNMGLEEQELENIFHKNAEKILNL
ncbi:MAG: amidohydrolase family protein [Eubacterium sp.]|nr:amidohydrolase family protein [Eubacterium sp.]